MRYKHSRFSLTSSLHRQKATAPADRRHSHILVPIRLNPEDSPALIMAAELAELHQSTLTVLHVRDPEPPPASLHGLDAIQRLYQPSPTCGNDALSDDTQDSERQLRIQLWRFLRQEIHQQLASEVDVHVACRVGNMEHEIATFADRANVDLVVIPIERPRWWLPVLPSAARRVLKRVKQQVVLVDRDVCRREGPSLRVP